MHSNYKPTSGFRFRALALVAALLIGGSNAWAQMSGSSYTIDNTSSASTTNFTNWASFVNSLQGLARTDGGPNYTVAMNGSVTVTVNGGPYTEQVIMPALNTSSTQTVTINGNGKTLQFNPASSSYKGVIILNGADYVTISKLTVINTITSTSAAYGIHLLNAANYNTISGCDIQFNGFTTGTTSTTSAQAYIKIGSSLNSMSQSSNYADNANYCTITGNLMRTTNSSSQGPTYGVYHVGNSSTYSYLSNDITISNNTIQNFFWYGIYTYFTNGDKIDGNDISRVNAGTTNTNSTYFGVYSYYNYSSTAGRAITIDNNNVHDLPYTGFNATTVSNGYGIYAYYFYATSSTRGSISGNKVQKNFAYSNMYGAYTYYLWYSEFDKNDISYNTCLNTGFGYSYNIYAWYGQYSNFTRNSMIGNINKGGYYNYGLYSYYGTSCNYTGNLHMNNEIQAYGGYVYGIYVYYPYTSTTIANNLIVDNLGYYGNYGIYFYNGGITGNYRIQQNTIDMGKTSTAYPYVYDYGVQFGNYGNTLDFRGNIIRMTSNNYGKYPVYGYGTNSTYKMDQNAYWVQNGSFAYYYAYGQFVYDFPTYWNVVNGVNGQVELWQNPRFINPGSLDYRSQNFWLQNRVAYNSTIQKDYNGANRHPVKSDIGAFENFCDLQNTGTTYNGGLNACTGYQENLKITIKNNFIDTAQMFNVSFSVNGQVVNETVSAQILNGNSYTYTFQNPLVLKYAGTNTLKIYTNLPDDNMGNDTQTYIINVKPAPSGSKSTFVQQTGLNASQDLPNYDVTLAGKPVVYTISAPKAYTNADYGTKWMMFPSYRGAGGSSLAGSSLNWASSTSTDGTLTFTPGANYTDSFVNIRMRFFDMTNNCDTIATLRVFVAPLPYTNFKFPTNVCAGEGLVFDNLSTISSGAFDSKWYFGDGDSAEGTSPVHTYINYGTYNVKLVNTSKPFGFVKDTTIKVTPNEFPNTAFNKTNSCEGKAVTFTNQTTKTTGGVITYTWDFGDKSSSTVTNPNHTYGKPGAYLVTLTATSNGCTKSISKYAYQFATPKAAFTATNKKCDNEYVTFTNNSTIADGLMGFYWDFNDNGEVSTEQNPMYMFSSHGMKTVKLRAVSEFGCADSVTKTTIEVLESPKAGFSNSAACSVDPTVFSNNTPDVTGWNNSYSWNFGDGSPASSVKSPTHAWTELGPKVVTLTVNTDNGCKDQITKTLNVGVQPVASFDVKDVCAGKPAVFQNLTSWPQGTINYNWDFNDGNSSTDAAPTHIYNNTSTKTYNVTLVAGVTGGCTDTMTKTFTVNENPKTCDFDWTWDYTKGLNAVSFNPIGGGLNGPQSGVNYTWVFDREGNSSASQPWINFQQRGTYSITMSAKNAAGCECSVTKIINASTGIAKDGFGDNVNVFPNPTNGKFFVSVNTANSDKLSIELFNAVGGLVKTISTNGQFSGTFEVAADDLANGIYLVKISAGNKQTVRKITVNK